MSRARTTRGLLLLAGVVLSLGSGCKARRRPLAGAADAGPAVVVVERGQRALPKVPLDPEKEPNGDVAHGQVIEPGRGVRGTIDAPRTEQGKSVPDQDLFLFSVGEAPGEAPPPEPPSAAADLGPARPPVRSVRVELSGVPELDLAFDLLDERGRRILAVDDAPAGEPEIMPSFLAEEGRPYGLRVRQVIPRPSKRRKPPAPEAAPPTVPRLGAPDRPYELSLQASAAGENDEREPNDDPAHASLLTSSGEAAGFFARRRDQDWLRLPDDALGPESGTLRLELQPVEGVAMAVKVMAGAELLAEAKGGRGEELRLRNVGVPKSGVPLLVGLRTLDGKNVELPWGLRWATEASLEGVEREPNDDLARASVLVLDGAVSGFLWPGDVDVYCIAAEQRDPERVLAVAVEGLERVDLRLDQLDLEGKLIAHADAGKAGAGEQLSMPASGCVRVSARPRQAAFEAPYLLSAR